MSLDSMILKSGFGLRTSAKACRVGGCSLPWARLGQRCPRKLASFETFLKETAWPGTGGSGVLVLDASCAFNKAFGFRGKGVARTGFTAV